MLEFLTKARRRIGCWILGHHYSHQVLVYDREDHLEERLKTCALCGHEKEVPLEIQEGEDSVTVTVTVRPGDST